MVLTIKKTNCYRTELQIRAQITRLCFNEIISICIKDYLPSKPANQKQINWQCGPHAAGTGCVMTAAN